MTLKGPITVAAGCTDAMHCYISREVHVRVQCRVSSGMQL